MERSKNSNFQLDKYYKRKQIGLDALGGKCAVCGAGHDLEFDHIDPQTKEFTITNGFTKPLEVFMAEVRKCQLLCHEHHKGKTKKEQTVDMHGTWGQYRNRKCRCVVCKAFVSKYMREHRLKMLNN